MSDNVRRLLGSVFSRKEEDRDIATNNALQIKSYRMIFQDDLDLRTWKIVEDYLLENRTSPSVAVLQALAVKSLQEDVVLYIQDLASSDICSEEDFRYFLKDAIEEFKKQQFSENLATAHSILSGDYAPAKGEEEKKGYRDAFHYVVEKGMDLVNRDSDGEKLQGDIRLESQEMIDKYNQVKANAASAVGILTGLSAIDLKTRGIQKGDLWLIVGFTSDGKSTISMNIAHSAVVRGYNVMFVSLEMGRESPRDILYCIHSGHRKFRAAHKPLSLDRIRTGTLSPEEEDFYIGTVIDDFRTNPEYGSLNVVQPSESWSVKRLRAEAELYHRRVPRGLDLIVIDYVNFLEHDPKIRDPNEALNKTIRELKLMGNTFSNGDKIRIVTPFQANRDGRKRAEENAGVYDLLACSNAHEAERSPDVVLSIFTNPEFKAAREAVISHLKGRDSGCCEPFKTFADFSSRIISDAKIPGPKVEDTWLEELILNV